MIEVHENAGDQVAASLEELKREKRVVETLYRVAQAVAERDDLREIVQFVTDECTTITGAQFGAFFYNVVTRDGKSLSLFTISGAPREKFEQFPMPRATHIFRPTFEGTAVVRIDDVHTDPRFGRNPPYNGMPNGHLPVRSYLAVPVFSPDGSVVGGLFFGHEKIGVFDAEHERIAVGIASHAGTAIQKARLLAAERKARSEAEARANAAVALECVEDGVVMVDTDGIVRLWNRAAATITGLSANATLGRRLGEALAGWERIALAVAVGDIDERVAPQTLPLDMLDGHERWLSIYGVAFGEGTVYAFRDVTGERELEALRADVIATVSHELRTPITSVYGAAMTLRNRDLSPDLGRQFLEVIETESERLTRLIDEILLTGQIDSGKLKIAEELVDPSAIISELVETASVGTNVRILVDVPSDVPTARADEDKLRQVLANLVDNAIKYGARDGYGTVLIRIRALANAVRFEVVDDGPGVPRHEQLRLFEKFYRLETHLKEGIRGTGLGLYISRELVHRMQGAIGIEPGGDGATFWVELPRA